jgi:hypothetical protein
LRGTVHALAVHFTCLIRRQTAITEEQEEPTIAVVLAAAERFGLKPAEAKRILREVFNAVAGWRATGRKLRLTASA